jgi:preprotein translocase subunit SecE
MADSGNNNSRVQEFCKGLKAEFRKIVWPTQEKLTKQTIAVVSVSLVLGLLISVLDWVFQLGLTNVIH